MASQDSFWFATVTVKAHQRSKPENGFDYLGHVSAVGAIHAKFLTLLPQQVHGLLHAT